MKTCLFFACVLVVTISCNKSGGNLESHNNEGIILDKIIKTTIYNSTTTSESIEYKHDFSGKMISEGNKKYTRDAKGRIINILFLPNETNRNDINVFYRDNSSLKVAYTLCNLAGIPSAVDSTVYERDNSGRIIQITSYVSNGDGIFIKDIFYKLFYDEYQNLARFEKYSYNGGAIIYCGRFSYTVYDNKINPAYSNDEVRMFYGSELFLNTSKNNVIASNGRYSRSHTYRADGRPLSSKVFDGGTEVCRIDYYYK